MASSNPHQILISYGAFFLPLAVLAGLSISVILPAALSFLIPAMDCALFISLPSLWGAFLSWITPSCLFVLLNGIIVVLSASSGAFSSSESCSGSEFYASLLGKMDSSQVPSSGTLMADSSALDSHPKLLPNKGFADKQHKEATIKDTRLPPSSQAAFQRCSSYVSRGTLLSASSQPMLCTRMQHVYHYAQVDVLEAEEPKACSKEEDDGVDEYPSNLSKLVMENKSFSHVQSNTRILEEENEEEEEEKEEEEEEAEDNEERLYELPKLTVMNKSFSVGCRSEPSSPQFVTPLKGNIIKRSLSVDSASFDDNHQASYVSPEELSDEAFRKRIEDFILRMNAQLRSQAK